ncbi:MAG: tetratricopeptide repeat protein [Melioribacteraceae bacterium]
MKIKPIYIYLGVIIVFIAAVIFFSRTTKDSNTASAISPEAQMPNDDIHSKMKSQGNGDSPNKSNVMKEAVDKINNLKAAVEKNPNDTLKTREYADLLIAHKPDEAIKLYERIIKTDPKRTDILLQLTYVYFNQGNINKAEEYNSKVLSVDKNNLIAQYNIGGLAQAKGDEKKAIAIWQDLAKKYPQTEVGSIAGEVVKQLSQKAAQTK